MSRLSRFRATAFCALVLLLMGSVSAAAQRPAVPRHPTAPAPAVAARAHVFVGGYFYDPFFGPYRGGTERPIRTGYSPSSPTPRNYTYASRLKP